MSSVLNELIESRQIRAFVAVARRGSFTQGAKDVFLTQSAVSHAIKSLEEDLSCPLFRRVGRRAALLPEGERFLQHCESILSKMHEARAEIGRMQHLARPGLRVGAPVTVCQHLLPGVLQQVQRCDPQVRLRVETGDNPQLLGLLGSGRIDLAVMVEPKRQPDLAFEPLFSDEVHFVLLPSHPWAKAREIPAKQVAETTLILPNKDSRSFELIMAHFRAARVMPGQTIELGSIDSIKQMVISGLGVGVAAAWPIRDELATGKLVCRQLGRRPLIRRWFAVHLKGRSLSATEKALVAALKKEAQRFEEPPANLPAVSDEENTSRRREAVGAEAAV